MKSTYALALAGLACAIQAHAGCGAAFCSTSNDWISLTQGVTPGWRLWSQVEYLNQSQLREGTDKISGGDVHAHHVEVKTINRNLLLGAEYGFTPEWSMGLVLPYTNRDHSHIHHHHGTPIPESWQFDEPGDVRLKLRYQHVRVHADEVSWSLNGGVKLPTGETDLSNSDGDVAERSVQPGTGTTDILLGAGLAYAPQALPGHLFANASLQLPVDESDGYEPGWRGTVQAGWQYPLTGRLDLLLQGNFLRVGKDDGPNAEPEDSGHTEIAVVPGLSYSWSRALTLYAQYELPLYQKVNGVQLTHDYALSVGLSLALD